MEKWLGLPYPLGATYTGVGVNFAVFSENATSVELCLFDSLDDKHEKHRIRMRDHTDQVWHVFIPGLKPNKMLIDPYAKAIAGKEQWSDELFAYVMANPDEDLEMDLRDSAPFIPRSVVIDPEFDWEKDKSPKIPLHESIIYEVHVKGFSQLWDKIEESKRGTYAALGTPEAIKYFKELGVNTIELLPVHQHVDDKGLQDKSLSNYWGYNTIGFFAPECSFSGSGNLGGQVTEFKQMVKNLHDAGLEVILDVVYNHTAEGNHLGPTLCFKGIDNASYYRLLGDNPRYYMDYTGTGNTLKVIHPRVLQLIMDSLRYWVTEMHVDGFRFDLASTLAREFHEVSRLSAFFDIIHQDPVISQVKLIAEPWDVGEGGYQVGNFPVLWSEWNGKYRDTVRSYWKGDEGCMGDFAYRLTGSSDLYQWTGKKPYASVNFITAHDGFTLHDLVSYNDKHNDANGEGNCDGDSHSRSWNCGAEGETDDEGVNKLRRRQLRNFLATLFLSQGVPMLCAGDEYGRTQKGNNNAYCQDNELSWLDWDRTEEQKNLFEFTCRLVHMRRDHQVLRRPKFFQGRKIRGTNVKDITWFNPGGSEMTDDEWTSNFVKCVGVICNGLNIDVLDFKGNVICDDTYLLLFNAHYEPHQFVLPGPTDIRWKKVIDTADEKGFVDTPDKIEAKKMITLVDRSIQVFVMRDLS